jgi:hypothetical protein
MNLTTYHFVTLTVSVIENPRNTLYSTLCILRPPTLAQIPRKTTPRYSGLGYQSPTADSETHQSHCTRLRCGSW